MKRMIIFISLFTVLSCRNGHDKTAGVEMTLNSMAFECNLQGERRDIIDSYEMFWFVTVKNNGDKPLMFGAYDPEFGQEKTKYGYFEFITGYDTIRMYTPYYPDVYKIEPGGRFQFRFSNITSPLINGFTTSKDSLQIEQLIAKFKNSKVRYTPLGIDPVKGTYVVNEIQDIGMDSLTVSYASNGKSQLLIDKIGNVWTYEIW